MDGVLTFGSALAVLGISLIVVAGVGSSSIEIGSLKVSGLTVIHRLFLGGLGAAVLVFGLIVVWPFLGTKAPSQPAAAAASKPPNGQGQPTQSPAPQPGTQDPPKRASPSAPTAPKSPTIAAPAESAQSTAARYAPIQVPIPEQPKPTAVAPALLVAEIDWLKLQAKMAREVRCAPKKCEGRFWIYIDDHGPPMLYGATSLKLTQDSRHTWKIVPRSSDPNLEFTNSCAGDFQVGQGTVWKEFHASFRTLGRDGEVTKI